MYTIINCNMDNYILHIIVPFLVNYELTTDPFFQESYLPEYNNYISKQYKLG